MSPALRFGPALLILLAVLVCALPWGLPPEFRLALPLLPYAVIHRCVERWGDHTPDWLVFLAGFATDVVGQGPLGYWAFIYLCGFTMIRSVTADRIHGFVSSALLFLVTIVSLSLMQWSLGSIYYLRSMEVWPLVIAAAVAICVYLAMWLTIPSSAPQPVRTNARLERGL